MKGAFLIVVYDKEKKELSIFNDLLSKQSAYFSYDKGKGNFYLSDQFFGVLSLLQQHNGDVTIDELGVKMMLKHRMFYDRTTYVEEVSFLRPYEYITVDVEGCHLHQLEKPQPLDVTMEEAAETIHHLFNDAVALQYRKNEENGYPQVITLSGGMDSRSTFLYSISQGYTSQQCYCYAESGSADFKFAEELANKHHCEFFYHSISNGNFLLERDRLCQANDGQMTYSGTTGILECLDFFNTSRFGLVHTGLGGGEIMGDMCVPDNPGFTEKFVNNLKYHLGKGKKDTNWASLYHSLNCSEEELNRLKNFERDYRDFNEFQNLNDIRRCLNAQKTAASFDCYYVSPFLDEQLFGYMLQLPYAFKKDRKLYIYWQKKYNPQQFATKSTLQLGLKPGNKVGYYLKRYYIYLANRMGYKTLYDMTPYDYWKKNNPHILEKQCELYEKDLAVVKGNIGEDLLSAISEGWNQGTISKENILTATWALTKIIEDNK